MNTCGICYTSQHYWYESVCNHSWCLTCYNKMMQMNLHACPFCRHECKPVVEPSPYILYLLSGGEPTIKWRTKRHKKKYRRNSIKNI